MNNILVHDGKKFIIGSYALRYALQALGVTVNEIGEVANSNYLGLTHEVMLHAHKYACLKDEIEPTLDEVSLYEFIDSTGGYNGEFFASFVRVMNESMGMGTGNAEQGAPVQKKKAKQ